MTREANGNPTPADFSPEEFWAEADALGLALAGELDYLDQLGAGGLPREMFAAEPGGSRTQCRGTATPVQPSRTDQLDGRNLAAPWQAEPAARPSAPSPRQAGTGAAPASRASSAKNSTKFSDAWIYEARDLAALERGLSACGLCQSGREGAPKILGRGSASPLIAVVPHEPEALDPESPAGALLAAIIKNGLKLAEADYHIAAPIKCLAKDAPSPAAMAACRAILVRQLGFLAPKIILALGEVPAQVLSLSKHRLGLLRPRTHSVPELPGAYLRVSYDLTSLLETPELKKEAWKDLQKIVPVLQNLKCA